MSRPPTRIPPLLLLVLSLGACDEAPAETSLVVVVQTDLAVPSQIDQIALDVVDGSEDYGFVLDLTGPTARDLPLRIDLAPNGTPGTVQLTASALFATAVVLEVTRTATFEEGRTVEVEMALWAACVDAACPPEECGRAGCGTAGDAGTDAPPPDAPSDGGACGAGCAPCETCVDGTCEPAPDLMRCETDGARGLCRSGSCCTGCWTGSSCESSGAASACGLAGFMCVDCGCGSRCVAGACAAEGGVTQVSVGGDRVCIINEAAELRCWGDNTGDALGAGTGLGTILPPTSIGGTMRFTSVSVGPEHACALEEGGTLHCWGENSDGRLGVGDMTSRSAPTPVAGGPAFVTFDVGPSHSCAIGDGDGDADPDDLYCWGDNARSQLGIGGGARSTPTAVATQRWRHVALGWERGAGLRGAPMANGYTRTGWGSNHEASGGFPIATTVVATPTQVSARGGYQRLALGRDHTCGAHRRVGGAIDIECWGSDVLGQLGDGPGDSSGPGPNIVAGSVDWSNAVDSGDAHSCAVDLTGGLFCWGANDAGQLGTGDMADADEPTRAMSEATFVDVSAGGATTCALDDAGQVWCAGQNDKGQIPEGGPDDFAITVPTRICP